MSGVLQRFSRRTFLSLLLATLFLGFFPSFGMAQATTTSAETDTYVEFLIGDRTPETRKWGHVSLRVVGPGVDKIFDFGRYGKMWGLKNASEGDPILRVWKAGTFEKYREYHRKDGGTTKRFRFESTEEKNARVLAYFARMIKDVKGRRDATITQYNTSPNYPTFHAVKVNCTTVSIEAFAEGFGYNLNSLRYATARTLQWWGQGPAKEHLYDSRIDRWTRIWWPPDLMALLEEEYVAKGLATMSTL